jgi:hypothetical protein
MTVYMWFTGINYYKLAIEKDRDSGINYYRPLQPYANHSQKQPYEHR